MNLKYFKNEGNACQLFNLTVNQTVVDYIVEKMGNKTVKNILNKK